MNFEFVLFIQLACCLMLTGLIWTVQLVHYPAFLWIAENRFQEFHAQHSKRITLIVGPLMLVELFSALTLVLLRPNGFWLTNFGLIALIWLCTALISVPIHNRLTRAMDRQDIQRLILTNWPRTLLWTARSILLAFALL